MSKYFDRSWFLFLILFPFFNPNALKYIQGLTLLYDFIQVWKLMAIFIIIYFYLCKRRISSVVMFIIIFESLSVTTSLINGIYNSKVFTNALLAIGISMFTELAIRNNFEKFCLVSMYIFGILAIINWLLCITFPNGLKVATLYVNWKNPLYFIGIDNAIIKDLLLFMMFFSLNKYGNYKFSKQSDKNKDLIFWAMNFICFTTLLIVQSATGLLVYVIYLALLFIFNSILKIKVSYKLVLLIYIIVFLIIVVLGSDSDIIVAITNLLGRSYTFSGRTRLWARALKMILQKPLLGYGYTSGNIEMWGGFFSAHNIFLELAIQGGFLCLTVFLWMILYVLKANKNSDIKYFNVVFLTIFAYLLVGLMETGINIGFYMALVLAVHSNDKYLAKDIVIKY